MRLLLFSLVSIKIPHSPSHGITAAAVLKDIPDASAVLRISGYIGDRIRLDIAKDARGIFSPFPACLRKPRFFMQLSQAIDRRNGIRRRLVQSLQEEATPPLMSTCTNVIFADIVRSLQQS